MMSYFKILSFLIVAAASIPVGCGRYITGRVIDADTGSPIQGAAVRVDRRVGCVSLDTTSEDLSVLEAFTDPSGQFNFDIGSNVKHDCFSLGGPYVVEIGILAPGYLAELGWADKAKYSTAVMLDRIRYLFELEHYQRPSDWDWLRSKSGPLWNKTVDVVRSMTVRAQGPLGVFVFDDQAKFDQILAFDLPRVRYPSHRTLILARDRGGQMIHGWDFRGTAIKISLPERDGWSLIGSNSVFGYPFLARQGKLYYPNRIDLPALFRRMEATEWSVLQSPVGDIHYAFSFSHRFLVTVEGAQRELALYELEYKSDDGYIVQILINPGSRQALRSLLPDTEENVECIARGLEDDSLVIVANSSSGRSLFYVPSSGFRDQPQALRVDVPEDILASEITACATARKPPRANSLYLAIKDRGIRQVFFRHPGVTSKPLIVGEGPFWKNSQQVVFGGSSGPKNFTGLSVAELEQYWEGVYAVAGDGSIYRFTHDGIPDRRIEMDVPTFRKR